ncbi:MAG TPA: glycosyltransferase N-terminal domain-containing protein [Thermoanaerobaculia bacterium]|nr:glycosyltransferase N-terminal domain-containing protein [Thermoanaerobaculia bacterium]
MDDRPAVTGVIRRRDDAVAQTPPLGGLPPPEGPSVSGSGTSRFPGFVLGAYGVAAGAAVAAARIALLRKAGASERAERLGTALPPCGPGRLLLHAVSAGEMTAASALASEIERTAGLKLLLTTGTREGRIVAEQVREACRAVEAVAFLPWDRPGAVRRWLARLAPAAVVTVEAELWPGLFLGARSLGIPVAVASARLRPGEAWRYARAGPFFRPVVDAVSWIGARTEEDRERFLAIGASPSRVEVTGDLKLDAPTPAAALPPGWKVWLEIGPPLLVAASTHAPEEELLLEAVKRLRGEGAEVRLALAPRHVARSGEVERLARQAGFGTCRLSGPPGPASILVVDTFGLLSSLWPQAAIGFLGGTLASVGGHSPVAAAEAGVPLLAGPSLEGVRDVADALRFAGALVDVGKDGAVEELAAALARLLSDEGDRRRRGEAGRRALGSLRGAAARTATRVLGLLASGRRPGPEAL